jgi:hypothetical protein
MPDDEMIPNLDAERPWVLINPSVHDRAADSPALVSDARWDDIPSPLLVDRPPRMNSAWGRNSPWPFELASLENRTATLLIVESVRGLKAVADYFRPRAWNPTVVVAHELEPSVVADALAAAAQRGERTSRKPPPFDLALIEPLIASEVARGNGRPVLDDEGPWFDRMWLSFPYPIDVAAIREEFELGEGVAIDDRDPAWVNFEYQPGHPDEFHDFPVGGALRFPTADSCRRREQWWQEWRRAPRPRIPLLDPFAAYAPVTPPPTEAELEADRRHAARKAARRAKSAERNFRRG